MGLAFFGFAAVFKGVLMFRSTFLPKALALLTLLTGLLLLTYLYPSLGNQLFPLTSLIGLLASISSIGWLLIRGVDDVRWEERAAFEVTNAWG